MTIPTLLGFLCGRADAIRRVAASRAAFVFALLMVLLAGIPREYDQEYLPARFWLLLVPIAASAVTATILFGLLTLVTPRWRLLAADRGGAWRVFLTLYWMTAPLAWLYAIPAERLLGAADSVRMNLALLGVVAAWRVLLITRVIGVACRMSFFRALFVVALFADALVLIVLQFTRVPLFDIMGGIHLTESQQVVLGVVCCTAFWGWVSLPVWIIGTLVVRHFERRDPFARQQNSLPLDPPPAARISFGCWALCAVFVLGGAAMLAVAQPAQQLRHRAETLLRDDQLEAALTFMSQHEPADFPPHWDPPPQHGYGETRPSIQRLAELSRQPDVAEWVRRLFLDKHHQYSSHPGH